MAIRCMWNRRNFRDTFTSWESINWAQSAMLSRSGQRLSANRQRGTDALSTFLMTLNFSTNEDLFSLYSSSFC